VFAVTIPSSDAVTTIVPSVPGDGIHIELFLGIGGGYPDPSHITTRTPDADLLSPRVDFPRPGNDVSISSSFATFFADTVVPPDSVKQLQPQRFYIRGTSYLKITKSLDRNTSTAPIDIRIGIGCDDGHYLKVGNVYLGNSPDHGFSYYWYDLSFDSEGLYPLYFLFSANAAGVSGLELSWNTASGQTIIPQDSLYTTVSQCSNSISFEEYPSATYVTDQYRPQGVIFNTKSGDIQITNAQPTKFVPVSTDRVLADPASPAANPGEIECTFVVPGTTQLAASRYFSFY